MRDNINVHKQMIIILICLKICLDNVQKKF